jgi:Flp pilus assembly protein TadG
MPRLMQLLRREDGAAGVVIALVLIPVLIGAAAFTVDLGSMFTEREQLKNGSDAAALAIAQTCAKGACDSSLGSTYVTQNANAALGGPGSAVVNLSATNCNPSITSTNPYVRVDATGTVQHPLATLLGNWASGGGAATSHDVTTYSCATWGYPYSYAPVLPFALGQCQFQTALAADPTFTLHPIQTILLTNKSGTSCTTAPSASWGAGGFGWVQNSNCVSFVVDGTIGGDTGASIPNGCKPIIDASSNRELLLPIFSTVSGTGTNAIYTIVGFAGFVLTAWKLPSDSSGDTTACGNDSCIRGYFTHMQAEADGSQLGGPPFGSVVVELAN